MKHLKSTLFITAVLFSALSFAANPKKILLKSGVVEPVALNENTSLSEAVNSNVLNGYSIIQFSEIPTKQEKINLSQNGIELLEYIPNYSFLVHSTNPSNTSIGQFDIISILPYSTINKLNPEVKNSIIPQWAIYEGHYIGLMVDRQLNVDFSTFENELISAGAIIITKSTNDEYVELKVQEEDILSLANLASVKFIDFIPAQPEPEDTRARSLHRGNMLDSDHALGPKYDGSGVNVAIADDGEIGPHIDTKGRVTSFATASIGTHGDMTTGITMGAGNLDPRYRGMATDAYLWYYSINNYPHIASAVSNYTNRGVVVTSTSYSEGCNAGYTATTRQADQQTRQNPAILHVFSAGNSANSNCNYGVGTIWGTITGGRKQGKAVIATGNLEYQSVLTQSSSRGPATDGRIKPDICSNGTNQISTDPNNSYSPGGGTSAAAPGIAGLAVQMYDGYRQMNGGADPESGLIKSAMLNTARDLGNPGPDFFYGWGRVNAHRAMKLIEENRYLSSSVSQGVNNSHNVIVTNPLSEIRFMVYWTDYEGSTVTTKSLVNDLDMYVIKPNGDTILPWVLDPTPNVSNLSQNAVEGVDDLNNMEQVSFSAAAVGTYTVVVNGTAIPQGPQSYFLLWETRTDDIEVTYPHGGEGFVPGESETIRWDAIGNTGSFTIQYSSDLGVNWNTIATNVSGVNRFRNWTVPNNITGDALIRVTRNSITGTSANPFSISTLPVISAQYVCTDSIRLSWNPLPGITEYEVSALGATHMDSIGRTTNTYFDIFGFQLSNDNWVSVKGLNPGNGITGRRANAVILPKVLQNCPIAYDFGITQLNSPGAGTISSCSQDKFHVQITINNNGDSVLTNVPLRLIVGSTTYHDTIPGPLASKAFQFFTFKDSLTLAAGSYDIRVVSDLIGDGYNDNDSVGRTINVVGGQIFPLPYSNDFESFTNCATTSDCGTTICNLNGGWVNQTNGTDDVFDMRVNSGTTPSTSTGPSTDHNPGTAVGKYIYSEASNGCNGVESRVLSPCIDLSGSVSPELSFWYHMNGADMGILRLDILVDGSWVNNIITPLFGDKGNAWLEQKVDLTTYAGKRVTFRFKVTTGSGFDSDLALDNVSINDIATGIENEDQSKFSLFPNPSKGVFNLNFANQNNRLIRVFNINGKEVYSKFLSDKSNQLDLSDLGKGIYFLDIEGSSKKEKIILL